MQAEEAIQYTPRLQSPSRKQATPDAMLQKKRIPGNKRRLFRFILAVLRYLPYLSTGCVPLFTVQLGYAIRS